MVLGDCWFGEKISIPTLVQLGAIYKNKKRMTRQDFCEAREQVRLRLKPRRFPVQKVDWHFGILDIQPDYLVFNKPSMVPTHGVCDNQVENVHTELKRLLGEPLTLVHRLDILTRGLLVLARQKSFHHCFQKQLEQRKVFKKYRVLTPLPLPLGEHEHLMEDTLVGAKKILPQGVQDKKAKVCQLKVLQCHPHEGGPWFESEIELVTGRHHQIRVQLSALGAPILGDILYGASEALYDKNSGLRTIALQSFHLGFCNVQQEYVSYEVPRDWTELRTSDF